MAAEVKSVSGGRLDRDTALRVAERMLVMRRFEEKTHELYERGLMAGMHPDAAKVVSAVQALLR